MYPARKRILVVDDDPDARIFLSNLLEANHFQSICAETGAEGLAKARVARPALIILDAMLPRKEAIQVYRRIKSDDALKHIPVIMLSVLNRKTLFLYEKLPGPQIGPQTGPDVPEPEAYLESPPEAEDLLALVRSLTETRPGSEEIDSSFQRPSKE